MKINESYSIEKLTQYVGNDQIQIKEMINIFLETLPPEINQLQILTDERRWSDVYKLAHRIKPSFEVFSMYDILEDIKKIEHLARENNIDNSLSSYIQQMAEKFEKVTKLLKREL